jgi:hypothetical protein
MPPTTIPGDLDSRLDEEIEGIIDRLEEFGERAADIIEALRAIQNRF